MSSDDIKNIVKRFYVMLRRNLQPEEIVTEIEGLTDFDVQQIKAVTKNEGNMLGSDKLLDALQRRSTRTFASFLWLLEHYHPEIFEKIYDFIAKNYPRTYAICQNYRTSQHEKPSAAVRPLVPEPVSRPPAPVTYESHTVHERTAITQRSQQQATVIREQESRDTYSNAGVTVQSFQRTTETRQVLFSEDTLLDEVPNVVFEKWASMLNEDNSWQKLTGILQLTRKDVKKLKTSDNPGEEVLDLMSSEESYTVRGLMHLLECVQLENVLQKVKDSLAPPVGRDMATGKATTETQTSLETNQQEQATGQAQDTSVANDRRDENVNENLNRLSDPKKVPTCNISSPAQPMNISNDSISNTEEEVPIGAEGGVNKTLVNNLNTTSMKFDSVGEVHIHLPSGNPDGGNTSEEKVQNVPNRSSGCLNSQTSSESLTSPSSENAELNREVSSDSNPSPCMVNETYNQGHDHFHGNRARTRDDLTSRENLFSAGAPPPDSLPHQPEKHYGKSLPDEDSPERNLAESESLPRVITQPEDTSDVAYEKNREQELEALNRDFQNQINFDSFRDVQNSIPGTSSSETVTETGLAQGARGINRLSAGQIRIQSPESVNTSFSHTEKNVEQESNALRRDLNNQPNSQSYMDLHNEENEHHYDGTEQNEGN